MQKFKHIFYILCGLAMPIVVGAQQIPQKSVPIGPVKDVNDLAGRLTAIGDVILYLLVGLAIIYIVYYIVQYFIKSDTDVDRAKTGLNIFYGIAGLAIIFSIWGLVNILLNSLGTDKNAPQDRFPTANFLGSGQNNMGKPTSGTGLNGPTRGTGLNGPTSGVGSPIPSRNTHGNPDSSYVDH